MFLIFFFCWGSEIKWLPVTNETERPRIQFNLKVPQSYCCSKTSRSTSFSAGVCAFPVKAIGCCWEVKEEITSICSAGQQIQFYVLYSIRKFVPFFTTDAIQTLSSLQHFRIEFCVPFSFADTVVCNWNGPLL